MIARERPMTLPEQRSAISVRFFPLLPEIFGAFCVFTKNNGHPAEPALSALFVGMSASRRTRSIGLQERLARLRPRLVIVNGFHQRIRIASIRNLPPIESMGIQGLGSVPDWNRFLDKVHSRSLTDELLPDTSISAASNTIWKSPIE